MCLWANILHFQITVRSLRIFLSGFLTFLILSYSSQLLLTVKFMADFQN